MTIDDELLIHSDDPFGFAAPPVRSAPWFLGDAPAPTIEPQDGTAMAEQFATLPFVQLVHHLLDFVGQGCRTTKQGELFATDRRQIERASSGASAGSDWGPYGDREPVQLAWRILTRHGWLLREDGWVRPTGTSLIRGAAETVTEDELDAARSLLAAALETVGTGDGYSRLHGRVGEDILQALLVATGPEGLILPDHPWDGMLVHCSETVSFLVELLQHRYIHHVPIDRGTGHVVSDEMHRLARVSATMAHLDRCGLVLAEDLDAGLERRPAVTYRAPAVMRGAIALVRQRRTAEGEVDPATGQVHVLEEW